MTAKSKRSPGKIAAIIDARGTLGDGTAIAALQLGGESLLERQLRLLPDEAAEICIIGGEAQPLPARFRNVAIRRVAGSGGLKAWSAALAESRSPWVMVFSAAQPFPEISDSWRVLAALQRRPAAGVFLAGRASLARAQGETVLSATPSEQYWSAQWPMGFQRALLADMLAQAQATAGAEQMSLCDLTLRLGQAIALVEGRRSGFTIQDPYDWTLAQALAAQRAAA